MKSNKLKAMPYKVLIHNSSEKYGHPGHPEAVIKYIVAEKSAHKKMKDAIFYQTVDKNGKMSGLNFTTSFIRSAGLSSRAIGTVVHGLPPRTSRKFNGDCASNVLNYSRDNFMINIIIERDF